MKRAIDLEAILTPIPGDNPAGEDLRYTSVYEDIKEARRADDPFDRGDWKHELKTSDWDKVIKLATAALTQRSKDLQIAAWLTEALVKTEGFEGLEVGLKILTTFLKDYWENVYPTIEDGDLEFRMAPIEFLNDKLWLPVKEIPVTDKSKTAGYSWLKWQESRSVGYEADTRNKYGDVDESKKQARDEAVAEGKITGEDFDAAVALSSKDFYESLARSVKMCQEDFMALDSVSDENFGSNAPRLAELRKALEDCQLLVMRIFKEKGGGELASSEEQEPEVATDLEAQVTDGEPPGEAASGRSDEVPRTGMAVMHAGIVSESASFEEDLWKEALKIMNTSGIGRALEQLLEAASRAPSLRERSRYRLLMAKLCLKAERPDLARPIVEELHALILELHLERWESPRWIAQVLDALYQCLTRGEPSEEDYAKARMLFQQLCTTDVTKAIDYRF